MLLPEILDQINILSIFNEDLSFKVEKLYNMIINFISIEYDNFIKALQSTEFIKFSDNNNISASIILNENFTQYTVLNIPFSYTEMDIYKLFNLDEKKILRMTKLKFKNRWVIVSENEDFNSTFEKVLRATKINGVSFKIN